MSGLKYTYFLSPAVLATLGAIYGLEKIANLTISTLQEKRFDLRDRLEDQISKQENTLNQLSDTLASLSEEVKKRNFALFRSARNLIAQSRENIERAKSSLEESDSFDTIRAITTLVSIYRALRANQDKLDGVKEKLEKIAHIENLREEVRKLYERLNEALKGELLRKWFPSEVEEISKQLREARFYLDSGETALKDLYAQLLEMEEKLEEMKIKAEELQEMDRARREVLEALRETVKEMGWSEIGEPKLENEADPRSDILYTVNTYSAGEMTFRISLDTIKVNSPFELENGFCFEQFKELSEHLRKLGVITEFKREEIDDEDPQLLERGALDLPDSGAYSYDYYEDYQEGYQEY